MKNFFKLTLTLTFLLFAPLIVKAKSSGATIDLTDATTNSGTGWTRFNSSLGGSQFVIQDGANVTITGTVSNGTFVGVANYATANITLNNVSISTSILNSTISPLMLSANLGANLTLTLIGTNNLTAGNRCAGLQAPIGTTLTITGTGSLTAKGGIFGAGIGGNSGQTGGTININGGTITASGNSGGSGIGGGCSSGGGIITINGGIITANGGSAGTTSLPSVSGGGIAVSEYGGGAGIGGGGGGASGNITICGAANISATGGISIGNYGAGAGIGSGGGSNSIGSSPSSGTITIGCNSQVIAKGGNSSTNYGGGGAGIGSGGAFVGTASGSAGPISIGTTASVTATGGMGTNIANGANIGNGGSSTSAGTESLYLITSSTGTNGSITPSGCYGVTTSGNQTYTITPNSGYVIATVLVDGVNNTAAVSNSSYTFSNVVANHTISASFQQLQQYTINASAGSGGNISPSGAVSVTQGSNQAFTFTPNTGYVIDQVLIDGTNNPTAVSSGSYTFTNVTAAHTISVSFKQIQYTITASAGSNGSISPNGNVTVNYGTNQAFTFTPNTGYSIDQVLIDGTNNATAVSTGNYTFSNVTANHTISVTFKQNAVPTYTITASAGSNGSISPSGAVFVNQGSNQAFTFTPNTGYVIDQVLIDGTNNPTAVSSGNYTFSNVTTAHTISVSFKQIQYTITASAGSNGSISPNGAVTVNYGSNQKFTFTPNSGYSINQVLVDGTNNATAVSSGSYTFSNVTANHTISVSFKQNAVPTYTITASAGSGGSISPSGAVTVSQGNNQTFTFAPNTGYSIDQVLVDGTNNAVAVSSGTYTFSNVTTSHTISVTFKQNAASIYTITATAGSGGNISPSGAVTVNPGNNQTFTFSSNTGYDVDQVSVDGVNNSTAVITGSYTFINVTANHTISVTFKQSVVPTYTITASAGSGGSIMPSGAVTVSQGNSQTFIFSPNTGYDIDQVLVDGTNNVTAVISGSYAFSNVTANHTISVSFKQQPVTAYTITASAGSGGIISPSGAVSVSPGNNQTFTFTPNSGYDIDQVFIDGTNNTTAVSTGSYIFTNVMANHTISVSFKQEAVPTYTITASADSNGSVSPSGAVSVSQGNSQTFTFSPNSGYDIDQVLVDGVNNATAVSAGSYTFTNVTANHTISVSFKQQPVLTYTITASSGNGGSISPSGNLTVNPGASQTFIFTPNSGYEINQVFVDGVNDETSASLGSYTFTNITANHTISVSFKQQSVPTYTINAMAGSNGGISPSGAISVSQGDSQPFTFMPNIGYEIDQVLVDGVNNAAAVSAGSYTFTNVMANHTISVSFKQSVIPTYTITASTDGNGNILPSGVVTVNQGDSKTFTFTPNTNYEVDQVIVDGVDILQAVLAGSYTFTNVTANHTILINFKPECLSNIIVQVWDDVLSVVNNPAHNGGYTFVSYQWLKNGVEIAGETSGNLYLANDADKTMSDYTCRVTTSNGQTLESCPSQSLTQSAMSVYPNPTGGTVTVESSAIKEGDKIEVYSSAGTLVKQYLANPGQTKIDIGNQPKGIYIIKVNGKQVKIILL